MTLPHVAKKREWKIQGSLASPTRSSPDGCVRSSLNVLSNDTKQKKGEWKIYGEQWGSALRGISLISSNYRFADQVYDRVSAATRKKREWMP